MNFLQQTQKDLNVRMDFKNHSLSKIISFLQKNESSPCWCIFYINAHAIYSFCFTMESDIDYLLLFWHICLGFGNKAYLLLFR